ncbi:MAG: hypothetical protein WKF81_07445, partial [Thermomicrobiales bacterium]
VAQSIEPIFSNLFVKSNLSGEFTIVNESLVAELEAADLWDPQMLDEIKYWDGSIQAIERIPYEIRLRYPTAFEVEPEWIIDAASRRQKWIDMGQSLNLYIGEPNGKKLNDMYMLAWKKGLKTTYYLRSRGATTAEKSTIDVNRFGIQPRWMKSKSASSEVLMNREVITVEPKFETQQRPADARISAPAAVVQPVIAPVAPEVEAQVTIAPPAEQEQAQEVPLLKVPSQWAKPSTGDLDLPIVEELDCEACQ